MIRAYDIIEKNVDGVKKNIIMDQLQLKIISLKN